MLKRMHSSLAQRCIAEAGRSPRSNPHISYPRWYVQRWHFLPEGYLSRRSAAGYETIIRRLYNLGHERALLKTLLALMRSQRHQRVLELGCGPGRALQTLAAGLPGIHLTGLDLSPFMLERAGRRNRAESCIDLVHGDGGSLPWSSPAFDAVVACHYFGHLPERVRQAAILETRRALTPDGRLYVVEHAWHRAPGHAFEPTAARAMLFGKLRLTAFRPASIAPPFDGFARESPMLAV